ncbi:hypothetical protein THRCLA_20069 [Thraustotheca clavata]|uniref:Uncharacterized protein n=1 Tax=Thraustotheca clavata TaxID=74557 RepID=A0A1W0ABR6_9STRA|nr:hypothetical protein THRCLA_20069 [Thraustotheca clavata]
MCIFILNAFFNLPMKARTDNTLQRIVMELQTNQESHNAKLLKKAMSYRRKTIKDTNGKEVAEGFGIKWHKRGCFSQMA